MPSPDGKRWTGTDRMRASRTRKKLAAMARGELPPGSVAEADIAFLRTYDENKSAGPPIRYALPAVIEVPHDVSSGVPNTGRPAEPETLSPVTTPPAPEASAPSSASSAPSPASEPTPPPPPPPPVAQPFPSSAPSEAQIPIDWSAVPSSPVRSDLGENLDLEIVKMATAGGLRGLGYLISLWRKDRETVPPTLAEIESVAEKLQAVLMRWFPQLLAANDWKHEIGLVWRTSLYTGRAISAPTPSLQPPPQLPPPAPAVGTPRAPAPPPSPPPPVPAPVVTPPPPPPPVARVTNGANGTSSPATPTPPATTTNPEAL